MAVLVSENVSFQNCGKKILEDLSVEFAAGDFISVVGPSGGGKSTFLKLFSHLISPTAGNILFKDKNIADYDPTELRKQIAYCFQTPCLFGDTVRDNLQFPYEIRAENFDETRVRSLFAQFKMADEYLAKDIKNLSGGEKQRLALIRSLIFPPTVLLLDECTSALDTDNTKIVEDVIASLNREGVTVLWITHNPEQSRKHANKVLTIAAGRLAALEVIK